MAVKKHIKHVRSSVLNATPAASAIEYGEIAVNYAKGSERLFIKNSQNEVVPFFSNGEGSKNMESITWSDLKDKRDDGELVPGMFYRITDYVTTTSQENTQSAENQFDVIVLALTTGDLSEDAYAALHEDDTYFSEAGSNLSAWRLKYCLDNDTNRFNWASTVDGKGVIYHMKDEFGNELPYDFKNIQFKRYLLKDSGHVLIAKGVLEDNNMPIDWLRTYQGNLCALLGYSTNPVNIPLYYCAPNAVGYFTGSEVFESDDELYGTYYTYNDDEVSMENNSATYISISPRPYNGYDIIAEIDDTTTEWFYTFSVKDRTIKDASLNVDENNVHNNVFQTKSYSDINDNIFIAPVTSSMNVNNNVFRDGARNNTFSGNCSNNSFGSSFTQNILGSCLSAKFGNQCEGNISGNSLTHLTTGNSCSYNIFLDTVRFVKMGENTSNNCFVYYVSNITLENGCFNNVFTNHCDSITLGNSVNNIIFQNEYTQNVIVENGNSSIKITSTETSNSVNVLRNITIAMGVNNTNTFKTISHNTLNDTFRTVYQPTNSVTVSV